ncbi:V-type proton ATPase subunit D, partial [Galemys pyrenaicus]
ILKKIIEMKMVMGEVIKEGFSLLRPRAGDQLAKLKRNHARTVEWLVELASLQTSIVTVVEAIEIIHK